MRKITLTLILTFIFTISYANNLSIIEAAKNGDIRKVAELIKKGVNINVKEPTEGQTALMKAAGEGHLAVVKLLVEKGAKINEKDNEGWTALIEAVYGNHLDVTLYLISKNANINDKTTKDWKDNDKKITIPKNTTILAIANIIKAKKEIIEALKKAGAK